MPCCQDAAKASFRPSGVICLPQRLGSFQGFLVGRTGLFQLDQEQVRLGGLLGQLSLEASDHRRPPATLGLDLLFETSDPGLDGRHQQLDERSQLTQVTARSGRPDNGRSQVCVVRH
jgi:hypothetical protein